ncbi:NAD(P)H-dependent oxidoreductase [Corynebacterium bovis]|uniref:CE1759 family FMN reductase n=1 Tax=Corynebacterium bovis TaxID=36808 RepID=UPI002550BEAA|nr:CE1759 family FMN reductase [Corynebacterium bovis]MDK8511348.1 NAD(P)H-dependent oxidoreductase [Corynebacterium bovis]
MSTLVVLNTGLSSPSSTRMLAERIAGAVEAQVSKRGEGLETRILDLRDYASDLATVMATGIPTAALTEAQELVSGAHALIAASPVFTASYSGLFKMFMDALGTDSLNGMPVVIAATAGTPRHSLVLDFAMRPLFTYLRAAVMPTGVFAATEDFGAETDLDRRVQRAAAELAREIVRTDGEIVGFGPDLGGDADAGAAPARDAGTRVTGDVTSFADLLRGHEG